MELTCMELMVCGMEPDGWFAREDGDLLWKFDLGLLCLCSGVASIWSLFFSASIHGGRKREFSLFCSEIIFTFHIRSPILTHLCLVKGRQNKYKDELRITLKLAFYHARFPCLQLQVSINCFAFRLNGGCVSCGVESVWLVYVMCPALIFLLSISHSTDLFLCLGQTSLSLLIFHSSNVCKVAKLWEHT